MTVNRLFIGLFDVAEMMKLTAPALFTALALSGCMPRSGTVSAPQLALSGQYSEQMVLSDHAHHVLVGHMVHIPATSDTDAVTALVIHQRFDGVHRLSFRAAWANGLELPYRGTTSRLDGCTHGQCRDHSVGMIFLGPALLTQARRNGLRARLTGSSDAIDICAPPALFAHIRAI